MEKYNMPIVFENMGNVLDDRFIKVKIFIAHTGENRNNSIFSKEVLESMIPSLSNTMILGYIATDEDGNEDFKGHEEKLVIDNGEFKIKYIGNAWGVIPESHNARFEYRYGEDGVEREYLVAEGLLWRKFPQVEEIFDRDGGYKSQSMELQSTSIKGYVNSEGLFVFTEAKFEGACILGEGVTPAMVSSTIEKFSVNTLKADLREMLTEFNAQFSKTQEKGDVTVAVNKDDLTITDNATEPETTPVADGDESKFQENQDPKHEDTPAEPEGDEGKDDAEGNADFTEDQGEPEDAGEPEDKGDNPEPDFTEGGGEPAVTETGTAEPSQEPAEKFTRTFELSHDDVRSGLYNALDQHEAFQDKWFWIAQVFDSYAIVEDSDEGKFFKVNYVKHENNVSIGEYEEIFPMFLSATEKQAIEITRNNFSALEQEVLELRKFKADAEMEEKEAKLATYSTQLSKEEYSTIQANLANFSMVEIEKEIGYMLLQKNKFSANTQEEPSRVGVAPPQQPFKYGALSKYFTN